VARRHTIEVSGHRRSDTFRLVHRSRLRVRPAALFWLAVAGWFGWIRLNMWAHEHSAGIRLGLAVGLPLLLAAAFGVAGLLLWLGSRRRRAEQSEDQAKALVITAYSPGNDGSAFEHQVAALLTRDGWEDVRVSGGSGDLGADVVGWWRRGPEPLFGVVQCKCYDPDSYVGSKDLQAFAGTCWSVHDADVAAFVTTAANFHPGAVKVAQANGIYLVAGPNYGRVLAGEPLILTTLLDMAAAESEPADTQPLTYLPARSEEATA
jgi:hypothetical protein